MRETLYSHVVAVPSLNVTTVSANGASNGAAVDLDQSGFDFRVATLVAITGTLTDGTYTFTVQESADGSTGWTDVPAERLQGASPALTATDDNAVRSQGVIPDSANKRFLRAVCTAATVTTGGSVLALFLLSQGSHAPVVQP